MRRHSTVILSAIAMSAFATGCEDVTQPEVSLDTEPQLSRDAHRPSFSGFAGLPAEAMCVAPPQDLASFEGYQPFVLPVGFRQEIIADQIGDFDPVAGTGGDLPDMLTLNESGRQKGRFLYRTHEVGSNGAVTVTDLRTGVTSLVDQDPGYRRLDGIVWGPNGTLFFAEETTGGRVFERDLRAGVTRELLAVGVRAHEGLRFDRAGNLYGISETTPGVNGSGAVFKFTPDRRGDYGSGQLYALKVDDAGSRVGHAEWVPLDRDQVRVDSDAAAVAAGATGWGRPEDVEIGERFGRHGRDVLYVAMTSEQLVIRVELDGDEAMVSNYVQEGVNVTGLRSPDNLALDDEGTLFIAEDNGPGDIWAATARSGRTAVAERVARFASLSDCAAEPTGIYFDKNAKRLYVNVQHAGGGLSNDLTMAITQERGRHVRHGDGSRNGHDDR